MIIHTVELSNFGIYGETQTFSLTPEAANDFNRPIILLRGKNGSGKTTFVEAVRLCLHGSLALGNRVSRAAYEAHLARRIHAPLNGKQSPTSTRIVLGLDYVTGGRKHTYRIERAWRLGGDNVKESLHIWQDDKELLDLETLRQKETFLRELVPPPRGRFVLF